MTQTAITAAFLPQLGPAVDRSLAHPKPGVQNSAGTPERTGSSRFGRAAVWAESPLQLLSAVEAHGRRPAGTGNTDPPAQQRRRHGRHAEVADGTGAKRRAVGATIMPPCPPSAAGNWTAG